MSLGETFGQGTFDFLAGGGEMGALIRATDWSNTALGPVEGWSPSLRMIVSFLLANRFPLLLWWGPDYISIYNDAYRPILGTKHPRSMGQPVSECWSEIWHILKPLIDTPFHGGPATWMEDIELEINRHGYVEETHFTIAYSPVPDERAPRGIGGVLATVHEITEKVVNERRVDALRDLGTRAMEAKTAEEACGLIAAALENHPRDVPFALLYLIDSKTRSARLAGATGVGPGAPIGPATIKLSTTSSGTRWPLCEALREGEIIVLEDLGGHFAEVPPGPWADPPSCGVVVPVRSSKADQLAGFLVAGVSARLRLDDLYRTFYELMARQIALAITNARAYEEERKRAEQLAEIDRAKTLFFSNVSHEFRTPLSLIIGPLTDALAARRGLEGAQLELTHRNSLRLLKLVNALLDFSRIEARRAEAVYIATDLALLTSDLASNFRSACERAGLNLLINCEPLSSPIHVDRDMWEKIVLNLLSNAFKFTFHGEIEVRLREAGGFAELSVRDTGVGIPADELPRLFERFHRIEGQRSRTHEGSGIGLALVFELVKLHGGTMEVESNVHRGSTFTVRVPFGAAHLPSDRDAASQQLRSSSLRADAFVQEALRWLPDEAGADAALLDNLGEPEAAAALQSGSRVLIADDNADMREYVRSLLGRRCEVGTVADGKAALMAIREHRPNLVLADVMMPEMDGFELLREIRGDPTLRDIPVILLSARAGEESRVEGLEAGADDYLVKPFAARELIARVSANLELARVRSEATAALRESEQRYRALVKASSFAVYRMNADWTQLLHLEGQGFIADTQTPIRDWLREYIHPDDQPTLTTAIREAIATKSMFELEHPVRRIDGSLGWTHSRAVPLLDQNGEIVEWFGAASDVTDRKRVELALRGLNETLEQRVEAEVAQRTKAEEALRQAQKMEAIGHLTGGIAHDFNNLLQVVLGNLDGLRRRINGPAAPSRGIIVRSVEGAISGAERAAILTHRLLAFSRQQPLEPRPVDVNRLVTGMSELLRRTLGESLAIESVLSGGLWQIFADPNQLENSILNLAVNARDAMPDGGKLTIETANAHLDEAYASEHQEVQSGQYVMVALSDTGTGMTKEVAESAFDPFFTTKEAGHGTGLGLSQVYGFVKQSNGHVRIYSEPGEGTTIRIYLPRLVGDAPVMEDALSRSAPSGDGNETILLVEDDEAVRELNAWMLRELNYAVIEAEDGAKALQILEAYPNIRVLFTDVGLPRGMNGRELAEAALRLRPNLRVLFTSGYAGNAIVHHGRLSPGIDLISKPFTTAALAVKIRELLDKP
jgi:signal transduction histidine kinase